MYIVNNTTNKLLTARQQQDRGRIFRRHYSVLQLRDTGSTTDSRGSLLQNRGLLECHHVQAHQSVVKVQRCGLLRHTDTGQHQREGYSMTLKEIIEASKRLDNINDPNDVLKELSGVVTDSGKGKEEKEETTA